MTSEFGRQRFGSRDGHRSGGKRPALAGRKAFRLFCEPARSSHRSPDHEALAARARFHLRSAATARFKTAGGEVQTYVLEPASRAAVASVLLVHGWTGEASFMSAFADFFCRRGLRVVLLDLPAHGASGGRWASLIDCALAVGDVASALGPFDLVVAHSIGALAALCAGGGRPPMLQAANFPSYVLVGMPDRFEDVTRSFGSEQGLSPGAQRVFERRLQRLAHRPVAAFTGSRLLAEAARPALLLHARDDLEVPFADAERMASACPLAELAPFEGLGHRAILYAPQAVRAAHGFWVRQGGCSPTTGASLVTSST